MSPLVSVIVPSYNHAPYIRECLMSALSQEGVPLEVVLVDDCSQDDSVSIARSILDPRLRVFVNDQNLGTYATQNRAMEHAQGEFIAVLNSDDLWLPGKLRAQMDLYQKHPDARLCYTLGDQIGPGGDPLDFDQHRHWPHEPVQDLFPLLLSSNRLLASSVVFRRGAVRFEESLRYSGDWAAWLQLAEKGQVLCADQKLAAWRQHSSNSYTRSKRVTLEEIRVRRSILAAKQRWLRARPKARQEVRKGLSDCAVDLTALYVLSGRMRLAKAAAAQALSLAPKNAAAHKRLAVSLMPAVMARKRLWDAEQVKLTASELRALEPLFAE